LATCFAKLCLVAPPHEIVLPFWWLHPLMKLFCHFGSHLTAEVWSTLSRWGGRSLV